MNGASADPCAKISSVPTTSITRTIGSNHHFLRTRMNAHNSPAKVIRPIFRSSLELVFHSCPALVVGSARDPEALRRAGAQQRILARESSEQTGRRQDGEVDDAHEDRRRDLGHRGGESHPGPVNRPEPRWYDERRDEQDEPDPKGDLGHEHTAAPPAHASEHREGDTDREAEPPAFRRAQSSWNSRCQSALSFQAGCWLLSSRNGPSTR